MEDRLRRNSARPQASPITGVVGSSRYMHSRYLGTTMGHRSQRSEVCDARQVVEREEQKAVRGAQRKRYVQRACSQDCELTRGLQAWREKERFWWRQFSGWDDGPKK